MTTERIRIISERTLTTSPGPGRINRLISITWQVPPRPPEVLFVNEDDLPDLLWLKDHPGETEVPEEIRKQGDEARRRLINQQRSSRPSRGPRTI